MEIPEQTSEHNERLPQPQLLGLINGVANHEAKMFATAVMANRPQAFSANQLFHEMTDRQGQNPGWIQHDSNAFTYCVNTLEPIGAVVNDTVKGRIGVQAAYRISEFGAKWGAALAGSLLDWSLQYPDLSVQQVFGKTSTSGLLRSPEVRYLIYTELLTSDKSEVSYVDIATSLAGYEIDEKLIREQLRDMRRLGLLDIDSKRSEYNPSFRIHSPTLKHPSLQMGQLQNESRILYTALQQMQSEANDLEVYNLEQLIRTCLEIDPDCNLAVLRRIFTQATSTKSTRMAGIIELVDAEPGLDNQTKVLLRQEHEPAIANLINRINEIEDGIDIDSKIKRAFEVVNNPDLAARIMKKAKDNSDARKVFDVEISGQLLNLFNSFGQLAIREAQTILKDQGIQLSIESLRKHFRRMVDHGVLQTEVVKKDPSKKTPTTVYSRSSYHD